MEDTERQDLQEQQAEQTEQAEQAEQTQQKQTQQEQQAEHTQQSEPATVTGDDNNGKRKLRIALAVLLALLLIGGGIALGLWLAGGGGSGSGQEDSDAQDWQGARQEAEGGASDGIAIPGFKSMTLKAGEKEQAVNLYNPESNDCYFVMTLMLPDGTELWKSDLVKPGKGFYVIELNQTLEKGTYTDSILKYQCYMMNDEQTELNGSEVKFELIVE